MKLTELADEVKALGELVQDVTQREFDTRREVAAIIGRLATVEAGMRTLDDTVTGMGPMLQKNTDLTARTALDVAGIKNVVDLIAPVITTLTGMVQAQQDREAANRWFALMRKRGISTGGLITAVCGAMTAVIGILYWLWTHLEIAR